MVKKKYGGCIRQNVPVGQMYANHRQSEGRPKWKQLVKGWVVQPGKSEQNK
jgi:hypothetical protein